MINLNNLSETELQEAVSKAKARSELKAKLVQVLDRGVTGDRLHVDLPPGTYGEWVPNTKMERYRMEAMGFEVDKEHASKRALHDSGAGGESVVADVIFMTCSQDIKDAIEEIRRENYDAANSPRGGKQKEERDFAAEAAQVGLPTEMKSRIDAATVDNIRDAITAKD